jgi:hydroxymethylglutaryl-CoA lyase
VSPWPRVEVIEESMREGMQIESVDITVDQKLELLDALSATGLSTIVVGSFVSPRWTPQMRDVDELVRRLHPVPGVTYTALALNERGRERLRQHIPPLAEPSDVPHTLVHLCDVFVQRNTNRTQDEEIASWDAVVRSAVTDGSERAGIGVNAAWGSNWVGPFGQDERMALLERQYELWHDAGIAVDRVWLGDPMGWNVPHVVAEQLRAIRARWPEIKRVHLHLHDARGTALASVYAALTALDESYTLVIDSSVGGLGGCPYGGHGRMTRMVATEDLVDLLDEMGVETGVDLDRLIEAALLAERVVGHPLWGHVSKAGPRPRGDRLFPMDLPFIETEEEAQHFRLGPDAYRGARSPWTGPIISSMRPRSPEPEPS